MSKPAKPQRVRALSVNSENFRTRWRQELLNWPVSELDIPRSPVILDAATKPEQAIQTLLEHHIRAAPVKEGSQWVGVFDLREAVKFALEDHKAHQKKTEKSGGKKNILETGFGHAMEFFAKSTQISTGTLKYLSRMQPFRHVSSDGSVYDIARILADGAHIVGVYDASNDSLTGVITQGTLFQQVCKKISFEDNAVPLRHLSDLGFVTSPVKSIPASTPALQAFQEMANHNLSGLAVVDDDGVLIHNTSATDIRRWLQESNSLSETIENFLIQLRRQDIEIRHPTCTCTMDDNFKRAAGKLQATRYHRLWIVDIDRKPIGVLALTDIFRLLTSEVIAA